MRKYMIFPERTTILTQDSAFLCIHFYVIRHIFKEPFNDGCRGLTEKLISCDPYQETYL
jgi:hypothetical protein